MHHIYHEVLELKGHHIIGFAYDGEECIEKLDNSELNPDFIVMDHRMPIINGLKTMKKL